MAVTHLNAASYVHILHFVGKGVSFIFKAEHDAIHKV